MGNEKAQTRGFEKALETATQNKKSPMNLSQERMRAIGAGAEAQLTQAQKRRPSLFSGMFASRVSFQVHGTQLEGKDGQELSQAGVVPLFAGAALDLSASSLIGNKRNGMVWAEGHHARLALSPEGTNAAELLHVEDIWIGLKNERDPSSASVIFSTNQPVSLGDDRYSLKAQMLFMTEEEETIKLVGAEVRNQEGDIVASSGLARITADGVLDGDRQDLFQKAAQKEAEEQQQETQQSQEEQKTEELAEEVTEQPVPQSSNERSWKGIREDWRRSDENIRRRLQREEAGREAEKKAAEEAEKEEKAEKEKKKKSSQEEKADQSFLESLEEKFDEKVERIKAIFSSYELGKAYEDPSDKKEEDGFQLPLAEIPILLPFIYADITLAAEAKLSYGFIRKIDMDSKLEALKEQATGLKDQLSGQFASRSQVMSRERAQEIRDDYTARAEALLSSMDMQITLGAYLKGSASIGLELAANAGLPGLLMLSAGVMGSVGVKGDGEQDRFVEGTISANVHFTDGFREISVDNIKATLEGSVAFVLGLYGGLKVTSPLFDWKKEILGAAAEKKLGRAALGITLEKPNQVSSLRDLASGWYVSQATRQSEGLMNLFLEDHPAESGFHIFDQDAYEIPARQADEVLEKAENFLIVYGEILSNGRQENWAEHQMLSLEREQLIRELNTNKGILEELLKVAESQSVSVSAVAGLQEEINKHQARLAALQQQGAMLKDNKGNEVEEEAFYQHSGGYGKFEQDTLEEEAKGELATRENLLQYEQERKEALLADKKYAALEAMYQQIPEGERESSNEAFLAYYQKNFKRSELSQRHALRGGFSDLETFEREQWETAVKKKREHLQEMLKICYQQGITVPEVVVDADGRYEINIPPDQKGKRSIRDPNQEFYEAVKKLDKEVADHLVDYATRDTMYGYELSRTKKYLGKDSAVLSIQKALQELENQVTDPTNAADPALAAYKESHRPELTQFLEHGGAKWRFISGKDIQNYEMTRAIESLPGRSKERETYLREAIQEAGLVHLVYSYEVSQAGDARRDPALRNLLEACIVENEAVETMPEGPEKGKKFAARQQATKELLQQYFAQYPKVGSQVLSFSGQGVNEQEMLLLLRRLVLVSGESTEGDWAGFRKHMQRLERMQNMEMLSPSAAFRLYTQKGEGIDGKEDSAGEGYLKAREKEHKAEFKSSEKFLGRLSYRELVRMVTLYLDEKTGQRFDETSHAERMELLRQTATDEEAREVYQKAGGGKGLNRAMNKQARTMVTPEMLFLVIRDEINRTGERHVLRRKLIREAAEKGTPYETLLNQYETMVREQSQIKNMLSAFQINVRTKYEKSMQKRKLPSSASPAEIMRREQESREELVRKHTRRIEQLEGSGEVSKSYLNTQTKGFYRAKKKQIQSMAKARQQALTPEERHQLHIRYEEARIAAFNRDLSQVQGGPDGCRNRVTSIDDVLQRLMALQP